MFIGEKSEVLYWIPDLELKEGRQVWENRLRSTFIHEKLGYTQPVLEE